MIVIMWWWKFVAIKILLVLVDISEKQGNLIKSMKGPQTDTQNDNFNAFVEKKHKM
jgi:hypothetical protein